LFYDFLEINMFSINILADNLNKNCLKNTSIEEGIMKETGKKREGN